MISLVKFFYYGDNLIDSKSFCLVDVVINNKLRRLSYRAHLNLNKAKSNLAIRPAPPKVLWILSVCSQSTWLVVLQIQKFFGCMLDKCNHGNQCLQSSIFQVVRPPWAQFHGSLSPTTNRQKQVRKNHNGTTFFIWLAQSSPNLCVGGRTDNRIENCVFLTEQMIYRGIKWAETEAHPKFIRLKKKD